MFYKLIYRDSDRIKVQPTLPSGPVETVLMRDISIGANAQLDLNHARHHAINFWYAQKNVSIGGEFHVPEI